MTRRRRLFLGMWLLVVTAAGGTVAYAMIEKLSLLDALYLSIITISTVGFAEPAGGFSTAGQVATIVLVVVGVGTVFYTATVGLEFLLEEIIAGRAQSRFERRRIRRMQNHVIVCGYGRVGRAVASRLTDGGSNVVVIEQDSGLSEVIGGTPWTVLEGDATHDEMLDRAGIESAAVLIAAVEDNDNLAIVLSARARRQDIRIIARASDQQSERKLYLAGADRVVSPVAVGAERLAAMAVDPELSEFIDIAVHGDLVDFKIREIAIRPGSSIRNQTLAESTIRHSTGALILAVRRRDGSVNVNPEGDAVLKDGDTLVAIGTAEQLQRLESLVNAGTTSPQSS
ncbi:MAG: potassium channel protein [Acidimicrobiia bacterium]|nr:potassium channel protein [Acidimicrobiia bacterium]